jgi:hypothetical protein
MLPFSGKKKKLRVKRIWGSGNRNGNCERASRRSPLNSFHIKLFFLFQLNFSGYRLLPLALLQHWRFSILPWRWRYHIPPKFWKSFTKVHDVTSNKKMMFSAVWPYTALQKIQKGVTVEWRMHWSIYNQLCIQHNRIIFFKQQEWRCYVRSVHRIAEEFLEIWRRHWPWYVCVLFRHAAGKSRVARRPLRTLFT